MDVSPAETKIKWAVMVEPEGDKSRCKIIVDLQNERNELILVKCVS